ncbi:universal stress protein [Bacillus sp. V59.32b]|uniref:universal stress protein n=1 Tax=Bacillus sp. V59.32b TaxID=1758642 RepID=UPI00135CB0FA|nr:universal stress protein [Bacillus sp. V59.32b]
MLAEFNHIIAAFDCSEGSEKAVEWGARLKRSFPDATLTIVHVFKERVEQKMVGNPSGRGFANDGMYIDPALTHPVITTEQNSMNQGGETHSIVKNSSSKAKNKAFSILDDLQAEGHFEILEGNPAESICSYAKRTNADIIIVGSSGKTGLKKLFLGSTSSKVANEAHCPVLIAK